VAAPCARWQFMRGPVRKMVCGRPFNGIVRPHQVQNAEQQQRNLARLNRYRVLRNWALLLGTLAFPITWAVAISSALPMTDSSRRLAVSVLVSAGFALLAVGGILHGLSRRSHGEV
jgi:hypothetical protein